MSSIKGSLYWDTISNLNSKMLGSKAPNYDACGLFRAMLSHNPPNYSHIVGLASHF